jgi:hypothetical protein
VVNTRPSGTRTHALITPDTAIAIQQTSATEENRVTATVIAGPRGNRPAYIISAISPPTHSDAPTRWNTRLLLARSWLPPEDEWPVIGTGSTPNTPRPNRTVTQPHDSTTNAANAMNRATPAVISHALACSRYPMSSNIVSGSRSIVETGRPAASATRNGTDATAPANHASADHAAVRSAA